VTRHLERGEVTWFTPDAGQTFG